MLYKKNPTTRGVKSKKKLNKNRELGALLSYQGSSIWPYTSTAWTDSRLEQVKHFKHWVFIAASIIAEQIANHKPNISYVYNDKYAANEKTKYVRKAITPLQSHEKLEPIEYDHPLAKLLQDPNEPDTAFDLWFETVIFLLLTGSAYWYMPKNKAGFPEAIWVVPSHWVWPIPGNGKMIDAYDFRPVEGSFARKVVPAEDVIHFRYKNPISRIDGYSPLTAIGAWIDVDEARAQAEWHTYNNGIFPNVAIQFDNDIEDPDEETLRRIEAKFISRIAGPTRSGKPIFLPPGVSVKPLTILPNQMVFGENADRTRDNILAAFRVPHVIAGITSKMTFGSNQAAQQGFCEFCLNPKCNMLAETVTEKLAIPYYAYDNVSIRIWFEDRTPNNPQTRDAEIKTSLLGGAITPNEIRALYGREPFPYEWANKPVLPVNMQPGSLAQGGEHTTDTANNNPVEQPKLNDEKEFEQWIKRGLINFSENGLYK